MIPDVVIYEHYKGRLDSGQQVLVQVFRDDHSGQVLRAPSGRATVLVAW